MRTKSNLDSAYGTNTSKADTILSFHMDELGQGGAIDLWLKTHRVKRSVVDEVKRSLLDSIQGRSQDGSVDEGRTVSQAMKSNNKTEGSEYLRRSTVAFFPYQENLIRNSEKHVSVRLTETHSSDEPWMELGTPQP